MFGKRETSQLRNRLAQIEYDMKLGKITKEVCDLQRAEVLNALRQLGEKLELQELQLLEKLMLNNIDTTNYVQVTENINKGRIAMAVVSDEARIQNT